MAIITGNDPAIQSFLKAWGIDIDKIYEVTIKIRVDDIVRVNVKYFPKFPKDALEEEELTYEMQKFYLTKIE